MASRRLPPAPHPIASAFFDAFDARDGNWNDVVGSRGTSTVARTRDSLGWRTRHSSSDLYPVSVRPVVSRRRGEEEKEVSFHVRQIFPRQSNMRKEACGGDGMHSGDSDGGAGDDGAGDDGDIQHLPISVNVDDCELGTGATVWPGSIVLLKYLEKMAHDPRQENILEGKTVVDLGSGTAVTSIAAALLGADVVVCTDGCDPVVELARENIWDAICSLGSSGAGEVSPTSLADLDRADAGLAGKMNFRFDYLGCKMYARKYRWGEGMPMEEMPWDVSKDSDYTHEKQHAEMSNERRTRQFDIILGADCIVPKLYPLSPLVDALDKLSGEDTTSYLSYEQRHFGGYDPATEFRRLAGERGLDVEVVPDRERHPLYHAGDIQIWRVMRGPARGNGAVRVVGRPERGLGRSGRSDHRSLLVGKHSPGGGGAR